MASNLSAEDGRVPTDQTSTSSVPNRASVPQPRANRVGVGTFAYRIAVMLLLCASTWFLIHSQNPPQATAYVLPGNTWWLVCTPHNAEHQAAYNLHFGRDGLIAGGSSQGKFLIISPNEIWLEATLSHGLGPWKLEKDRWSVAAVGNDLVLERKSAPNDRMVLRKVSIIDEQILRDLGDIRGELQIQGRARQAENTAIQREIQSLREMEKKRAEEGKK